MPKGVFLALSNAASDDVDDEFNQWYDDVHAKEVLALPGVNSCRRFKLASAQIMPGDDAAGRKYLAIYEVDVDDWQAFADAQMTAFGEGRITVNPDLLQMDPMVMTMCFEEISQPS
ncbi:MAG: hypothetical protein EXQ79_07615 [Acidimicrobiia bacterium]|nr:hypothetical protein [Acidimicrobiia bacterium]